MTANGHFDLDRFVKAQAPVRLIPCLRQPVLPPRKSLLPDIRAD